MHKKIKNLLKHKVPFEHYFEHNNWSVQTNGSETIFKNKKANYSMTKRNMVCLSHEGDDSGWYIVEVRDFFSRYVTLYTPELDCLCSHKFDDVDAIANSSCYVVKFRLSNHISNSYAIFNPDTQSFLLEQINNPDIPVRVKHIDHCALLDWVRIVISDSDKVPRFLNLETGETFMSTFEKDIVENIFSTQDFSGEKECFDMFNKYHDFIELPTLLNLFYSKPALLEDFKDADVLDELKIQIKTFLRNQELSEKMVAKLKALATSVEVQQARIKRDMGSQPGEE